MISLQEKYLHYSFAFDVHFVIWYKIVYGDTTRPHRGKRFEMGIGLNTRYPFDYMRGKYNPLQFLNPRLHNGNSIDINP